MVPPSFFPIYNVGTGSLTTYSLEQKWIDISGLFTLPYGTYLAVAGSATLSTMAAQVSMVWEEIPV